jgi:hypothetical protein
VAVVNRLAVKREDYRERQNQPPLPPHKKLTAQLPQIAPKDFSEVFATDSYYLSFYLSFVTNVF